jgi:uncharacterized protein (TIGR03000 family)
MYSVVLVAALVTTSTTPNWCHRCYGGYSCYSGYSCYAGCGGYAGYASYSGYGCYVGYQPYTCAAGCGCYRTIPGYGFAGGGYGYHGGCYGAVSGGMTWGAYYIDPSQTYGQGCYGCYGGYAGYGIPAPISGALKMPETPKDAYPPVNPDAKSKDKKVEEIAPPKEKTPAPKKAARATIRMQIPQGAKLYVDGNPIEVMPGTRVFHTPVLNPGARYFYDFRLEVAVNGEIRREDRRVILESNQEIALDFSNVPASPAIASRVER